MGTFVEQCRNGDITCPQQKGFDPETWTKEFRASRDQSIEGERLYEAGLWYHNRFSVIRMIQASYNLTLISERQFKQYVVALLNRLSHEAKWFLEDKAKSQGFFAREDANVDGFESTITAGRLLLAHAGPFSQAPQHIGAIQSVAVESFASLAVIYDDHQSGWAKCLWRGHFIDQSGESDIQRTAYPERERQHELSWQRHQSLLIQKDRMLKEVWSEMEQIDRDEGADHRLEVAAVQRVGFQFNWQFGKPSSNPGRLPLLISMFTVLEEAHFKVFADKPFKRHPTVTLRLLAEVFALLSSLARKLGEGIGRTPWNSECVPEHCPVIEHKRLVLLVVEGVGILPNAAEDVLSYLKYGGHVRHDLWSRPLVPLGLHEVAIVLPPLIGSNPTWLLKNWMHDGGLQIDEGGEAYEQNVREQLRESCRLRTAEVLPHSLVLDKGAWAEQIDLVIRIGNTILIGEVKCSVFPTRAEEITNYEDRLAHGAEQAIRKAKRASNRKGVLARLFKGRIDPERPIDIVPLVLSNLPLAVGQSYIGIPVVDYLTLANYLNSGEQESYAVLQTPKGNFRQTHRILLYDTEEDAEAKILDFLRKPASLTLNEHLVKERIQEWFPLPSLKPAASQRFDLHSASRTKEEV